MPRLFIDITELATWQGKLTGVPRVMNELATRFAQREKDECFVIWSGHLQAYQQFAFTTEGRQEASLAQSSGQKSVTQKYVRAISIAKKIKHSSRFMDKALSFPERVARKFLQAKPYVEPEEVVSPDSGDTLLVLADWHGSDVAFIDYLMGLNQKKIRIVQISYDMLPIVTPQFSGHATETFTQYVNQVYPVCDSIIAISKHTKQDIEDYLNKKKLHVPPVEVMRLGDDFAFESAMKPADKAFNKKLLANSQYVLCVGTVEARKNHALLYETYKLAFQRGIDLPALVIVGRLGWLGEDVYEKITNDPDIKEKFIFLQNTSDAELSWLYEHCIFSIYPSFYEGWGLPVAESIARGIPCLASDTSSIPEIAGDLINYFDPSSPKVCLTAIQGLLDSDNLNRAKARLKEYKPTSWQQTFEQVNKIVGTTV